MEGIKDKVIVITGGSSGMGEAAGRYLAERGARVVIGARRGAKIGAIAADIRESGFEASALEVDVTSQLSVSAFIDAAVEHYGRIDVLINNAGVMPLSPLEAGKVSEWDQMIDVNLKGTLYGIAATLPHMLRQGSGHIINNASTAAHVVFPSSAVYSATKFAVRAVTEGLRQEMSPHGIRATLICPGAVKTELLDHISGAEIQSSTRDLVARIGIPAESFARMVAFAISQPDDVGVNEVIFRPVAQQF